MPGHGVSRPPTDAAKEEQHELGPELWENVKVVFPPPKKAVTLRVDGDVLDWFKKGVRGTNRR